MVNVGKGRLFKRADDKYLIYIPKDLATDSMFPWTGKDSVPVKISFRMGRRELLIEPWQEPREPPPA